jgi:biopolymer transport protein ExbD
MARRSLSRAIQVSDEINISPLIDMVFILLIFFIVTTVFVEETGVNVNKPQASAAIPLEANSILLAITDQGKVVYGGREVGIAGVRSIVKRLVQGNADMPTIVQADKTVPTELLVKVIDEAKLGGAKAVSISTEGNR